jgi:septum formation topological specificity factor MinE
VNDLFTDMDYFEKLKDDALKAIEKHIPYEELVS